MEIGQSIELNIVDLGINGEGIGKYENCTFFIDSAVPGDFLKARITQIKKNFAIAKLEHIIKPSKYRIKLDCVYYNDCGGCNVRHIKKKAELTFKEKMVIDNLKRIGDVSAEVLPIISEPKRDRYRNKCVYHFGKTKKTYDCGFYRVKSHEIVPISDCLLSHKDDAKVLSVVKTFADINKIPYYDVSLNKGILKHVLIRRNQDSFIVCIVINGNIIKNHLELIEKLKNINGFSGLIISQNKKKTSEILGDSFKVLYGQEYLIEQMGHIKYKVAFSSFMQVNSGQAQKLYETVKKLADLSKNEVVFDFYCGVGAIALFLARDSKMVYGIDITEESINNAKENMEINDITNCEFIACDAITGAMDLRDKGVKADLVVLDPPRSGCDKQMLAYLLEEKPKTIIYVSCNPSTLSRDLKTLSTAYDVETVQPVDMFPGVYQVECIVKLKYRSC